MTTSDSYVEMRVPCWSLVQKRDNKRITFGGDISNKFFSENRTQKRDKKVSLLSVLLYLFFNFNHDPRN